jgi:type IX secretion system PorP/SprF family membrane protein
MRRLLFGLLCGLITVFDIRAQQDPQYSQYMFNQLAVNPGYAGSHDAICLSAVHRQQWVGMDGAPVTSVFSANAPFKLFGHSHGVGLVLMSDELGFNQDVSIGLNYAYRLNVGSGKLGIGVSGMFLNKALDAQWNTPGGISADNDPFIPDANESVMGFDLGFGLYYRAERVYLGISSTHILEPKLRYDESDYLLKRHYYAIGGCLIPLNNPAWELAPSVMAYSDGTATQFSGNINVMFNKKIWGGVGYRLNDAVIAMVGVDLFNGLKMGYSFDYSYTDIRHYSGTSHEITLSYCFNLVKGKVARKYKSVRFL